MSKIQKPFGRVAKRIIIEADDNGTIQVTGMNIPLIAPKFGGALIAPPMDSREMVLALMKVVMDYTSALFENLTMKAEGRPDNEGKQAGENKGQPN
jgi:hypothetical protein